jgi:hypothetical protein
MIVAMGRILFEGSFKKYLMGSYIFDSFKSLTSNSIELFTLRK